MKRLTFSVLVHIHTLTGHFIRYTLLVPGGLHLLQGWTCCAFRDGILHTLVVTSGYLSYCCLSIISNHSAHSPLTSDINKAFPSTQLPLTGYVLFFGPFSRLPGEGTANMLTHLRIIGHIPEALY